MIRIVILLLALSSGGVAAWLTATSSEEPTDAIVTATTPTSSQEILVASSDMARGAVVEKGALRWQRWEGDVPPAFISRADLPDAPASYQGWHTLGDLVTGEPIRRDRLSERGAGFLSSSLPGGMRAIAVRVTAESTAGGFILPDDRVDVIHTVVSSGASGAAGKVMSRTLLTNVRVLAIDQVASDGAGGAAVVGKTATLEVKPEQIAIITAAEASGTVSLALRSTTDNNEISAPVREQTRQGVVRVFGGGREMVVQVPLSGSNGS